MSLMSYLRARMGERSSWAGIGIAVTASGRAALSLPLSWIAVVIGTMGVWVREQALHRRQGNGE